MKTLKLILAWLDWSTYCKSDSNGFETNYKFPNSLCLIFWRTLFSIISLPITWFSHIWNFLFVGAESFRTENYKSHKLNILNTSMFTICLVILGFALYDFTDGTNGTGGWGWNWFHQTDSYLLSYFKIIGAGAIFSSVIIVGVLIIIGLCYLIFQSYELIKNSVSGDRFDENDEYITSEERVIPKAFHAIKNKYCPTIDWSDIRKMKK